MAWYINPNSVTYQQSKIPEIRRKLSDVAHPETTQKALMQKRRKKAKEIFQKEHPELSEKELEEIFHTK